MQRLVMMGRNVRTAAGSVVTKDVPDHALVAGVPAVVKRIVSLDA